MAFPDPAGCVGGALGVRVVQEAGVLMNFFLTNASSQSAFAIGMCGHFGNALGERFAGEQAKPLEGAAGQSRAGVWRGCWVFKGIEGRHE